jgi:hypothetical protein
MAETAQKVAIVGRVPEELKEQVQSIANKEERSLAYVLERLIRRGLAAEKADR